MIVVQVLTPLLRFRSFSHSKEALLCTSRADHFCNELRALWRFRLCRQSLGASLPKIRPVPILGASKSRFREGELDDRPSIIRSATNIDLR